MNPLISVIVPCYNQAQYLDECLQSVLDQTYQNWECIIVNDGSPDHTEEVAKKWLEKDNRFRYIYKENGGLSSARNAGIREAKGEYLFFLDCDDLLPNIDSFYIYSKHINIVKYDFISSNLQEILAFNKITKDSFFNNKEEKELLGEDVFRSFLKVDIPVIACNKLISRNLLLSSNITFKEGVYHEDELFTFLLCFFSKRVLLIQDITYQYNRQNSNSITLNKTFKHFDDLISIISYKINFYTDNRLDFTTDEMFLKIVIRDIKYILNYSIINSSRKIWIRYYNILRSIYTNSFLMNIEKHFLFPANYAFYIHTLKTINIKYYIIILLKKHLKR